MEPVSPSNFSEMSVPTKDLEGVSEPFEPSTSNEKPLPNPKRQKKIAVLTSGGDSAGMNAAGESNFVPRPRLALAWRNNIAKAHYSSSCGQTRYC